MKHINRTIITTMVFLGAVVIAPVDAAEINFSLIGDTNNLVVDSYNDQIGLPLANLGTGAMPAFSLAVGDSLNVHVALNNSITMPGSSVVFDNGAASSSISLNLGEYSHGEGVQFDQAAYFYDHGVQVSLPSGFVNSTGSGGSLALTVGSQMPTSSFSFDEILFNTYVTFITGPQRPVNDPQSSLTVLSGTPSLSIYASNPHAPTAPLPATAWLFGSGLLALVGLARKQGLH